MKRLFVGPFAAIALVIALVGPVSAHGDHDARPLARGVAAGPYVVSLWQVYPDSGTSMTPHLIVMFDGGTAPAGAAVGVSVNAVESTVIPSTTTASAWETTDGVAEGDMVAVTIADGARAWALDPVVVPPPPTSMLPMQELIWVSIALTAGAAWWVASRTARAWRRPAVTAS